METILEAMLIALLCICIMAYSIIHISHQWKEISLKYNEMRYLHTAHANEMSDALTEIQLELKTARKTMTLLTKNYVQSRSSCGTVLVPLDPNCSYHMDDSEWDASGKQLQNSLKEPLLKGIGYQNKGSTFVVPSNIYLPN